MARRSCCICASLGSKAKHRTVTASGKDLRPWKLWSVIGTPHATTSRKDLRQGVSGHEARCE